MSVLRYQLEGLRDSWNRGYRYEVWRTGLAFVILYFIAFAVTMVLPGLRETLVGHIQTLFGSLELTDENGKISALFLFSNNFQACCMMMIYGLIPFVGFTAFPLGINSMLLGVLLSHSMAAGIPVSLYLASLLPHAIFELPALVLALAMGFFVCGQITGRCKGKEESLSFWECLTHMSRVLLLITPLLLLAALTEAYVTPMIAAMLQ